MISPPSNSPLENPFYYLENFSMVLRWIAARCDDLLDAGERAFIEDFFTFPQSARALLVRMIMRRGELLRESKLRYAEIGPTRDAAEALLAANWLHERPPLTIEQLFKLCTKPELATLFPAQAKLRKADQLDVLRAEQDGERCFDEWGMREDRVYQLTISGLCDRMRLMFFGNAHQDWTEFVLADLGIFRYEQVSFSRDARAFRVRADVDDYLALQRCRARFEEGELCDSVLADIPSTKHANPFIEKRRAKLLFQLGQEFERAGDYKRALEIYQRCDHSGARQRAIRVLELLCEYPAAHALALEAQGAPESPAELQQVQRMLPRLRRRIGLPRLPASRRTVNETMLQLPFPSEAMSVEEAVRRHFHTDEAPVFYVENALVNSLFGLLCWEEIFLPLPGAFFHPYQSGPADLHAADFHARRAVAFARRFAELETQQYKHTMRATLQAKAGLQSPFVFWGALSEALLELALACIPPQHLHKWFLRILEDVREHRTGFPDLIQFWPAEARYCMIEVKGPGDRLQDNQLRLLDFCALHDIPVSVCYLSWTESE